MARRIQVDRPDSDVVAIYEGVHPHLGNKHILTLYADGMIKIEREAYYRKCVSRYDGSEIIDRRSYPVIIEPQDNHHHLISLFKPKESKYPNIGLSKV